MTRTDPEEGEVEEEDLYTVIGVVEDIKHFDLTASESEHVGTYYFAYRQQPRSSLFLVVRSPAPPGVLVGSIRSILTRLDPALPLFGVQPMDPLVLTGTAALLALAATLACLIPARRATRVEPVTSLAQ